MTPTERAKRITEQLDLDNFNRNALNDLIIAEISAAVAEALKQSNAINKQLLEQCRSFHGQLHEAKSEAFEEAAKIADQLVNEEHDCMEVPDAIRARAKKQWEKDNGVL